jgi:hypothetical protein
MHFERPVGFTKLFPSMFTIVACNHGVLSLVAQFGFTLTSTCLGLELMYLVIIRSSRCTPSLRTGIV